MKSVLIIGMGRTGRHLASKMQALGNDVMIVDKNPAIIEALSGRFTDSNICDCTNDTIIKALGVDNFDICFVTIGEDFQASLVVTSLLKQFGARMIVSKAKQDIQADLLRKIGADEIVCPEREIAEKLAVRYNADNIFDFIPLTADYSIYELPIQAAWIGQTLSGRITSSVRATTSSSSAAPTRSSSWPQKCKTEKSAPSSGGALDKKAKLEYSIGTKGCCQ